MIMRMMKNNRNETIMVIGIDHGYGNMKQLTNQMCRERGLTVAEKGKHFDGSQIEKRGSCCMEQRQI